MPAWAFINVIVAPWIFGHAIRLQIRATPISGISRRGDEVLKAIFAFGIIANIDLKRLFKMLFLTIGHHRKRHFERLIL